MDNKEKIAALEEANSILKKRVAKLSANGIRNMDARLESLEKHVKDIAEILKRIGR